MKRFLNFFDRNFKTILKWLLVILFSLIAYYVLHFIGTAERGYDAVGGEILGALAIPLYVWIAPKIKAWWKETKELFSF